MKITKSLEQSHTPEAAKAIAQFGEEALKKEDADKLKAAVEAAGGKVELIALALGYLH